MFNAKILKAMSRRNPMVGDQVGMLAKIEAPTLITYGRDDRVTPLDSVLVPMRVIPKCEVHIFPDCGHWAMIERKDEFEDVVLSFLLRDRRRQRPDGRNRQGERGSRVTSSGRSYDTSSSSRRGAICIVGSIAPPSSAPYHSSDTTRLAIRHSRSRRSSRST